MAGVVKTASSTNSGSQHNKIISHSISIPPLTSKTELQSHFLRSRCTSYQVKRAHISDPLQLEEVTSNHRRLAATGPIRPHKGYTDRHKFHSGGLTAQREVHS